MVKKEGPRLFEILGQHPGLKSSTPVLPVKDQPNVSDSSSLYGQGGLGLRGLRPQETVASVSKVQSGISVASDHMEVHPDWDDRTVTFSYTQLVFYLLLIVIAFVASYILGHEAGKRRAWQEQRVAQKTAAPFGGRN